MKICSKCNQFLPLDNYYFRKDSNSYRSWCKSCEKARVKGYCNHNKEIIRKNKKEYYNKNKELIKQKSIKYYEKVKDCPMFKESNRKRNEEWRRNNPEKHAKKEQKRRLMLKKATPKWLCSEEINKIKSIYIKCKKFTKISNLFYYHVDHIIPLKGNNVCGLHVPWNLQIIEKTKNLKKFNKTGGLS